MNQRIEFQLPERTDCSDSNEFRFQMSVRPFEENTMKALVRHCPQSSLLHDWRFLIAGLVVLALLTATGLLLLKSGWLS